MKLLKKFWASITSVMLIAIALGLSYGHITNAAVGEASQEIKSDNQQLVESLPGFTSKYARINGIRLHYVEGGEGEALVLIADPNQHWWSFSEMMPKLAKKYKVIAVDLRGSGASDRSQDGNNPDNMAQDIYELAQFLGHHKIYLATKENSKLVARTYIENYPRSTYNKVAWGLAELHSLPLKD